MTDERPLPESPRLEGREVDDLVHLLTERDARERVFESFPDAVLLTDAEGIVRDANRAALSLLGRPAEAVLGRPISESVIEEPGREDRPSRLTRAGMWQGPAAILRSDGTRASVHARSMVLAGPDEPMHLLVLNEPPRGPLAGTLTGAEDRLSAIVDSAMDAIVSIDAAQRIVVFNAAAERLFGCSAAEAIGQPLERFIPERVRETHRRHVDAFATIGDTRRQMGATLGRLTARRADGEEFPIEATISTVQGRDGPVLTAIVRDVTGSRRTDRERDRLVAQERLTRAEASRVEERARRLRTITDSALTHLSLDDLFAELLGRLSELLGTDAATVLLMDRGSNSLRVRATHGLERTLDEWEDVPFGMGVAGTIAAQARPLVIGDLRRVPAVGSFLRQRLRSLAGVPIVHEDRVTGVLHVGTVSPRRFDEEDLSLLEIVASRLAPAIENARLHEAEREARLAAEADAARLRLSQSLVEALSGILSLEEVARRILDHIVPELGALAGSVAIAGEGPEEIRILASTGYPQQTQQQPDDDPPPEVAVLIAEAIRDASPSFISSLPERDAAYPALAGLASVGGSWVSLPLMVDGAARGALTLSFPGSRSFDDPDRRLMTMLAHQCSQALDRSTIYERERQMRADVEATGRRLSLLQSLTAAFSEALTGDRIARIVVTKATAAIGADSGVLLLLDEDGASLEIRSAFGYPDEALAGWERFPVNLATPAGDAVSEGRLVVISSPEEMVERYPLMASSVTGRPMGPTAVVPILVGERALGVVSFSFPPHHVLGPSDHGLLSALGSHAGQALERARLFETELVARREAEQERSRTEHLQAVTEALIDLESPAAVLDVLVDQSLVALGAVGALVVRATGDRGLELAAARGYPAEVTAPLRRFGLEDGGALAQAARTRLGVWTSSAEEAAPALPPEADALRPEGHTGAFAALPLTVGDRLLGVLGLQFAGPRVWDEDDRGFIRAIARQCAQAWSRALLHEAEAASRRDLRRSERRYRSLVEAISTVEWTVDPAGAFIEPQLAWEAYTGQPWAEHRGLGWINAIHPDDQGSVRSLWFAARASGDVFESEGRLWHAPTQAYRRFVARAAPVRDDDGRIVEWVGSVTDVHEQRLAEQASIERERANLARLQVASERLAFLAEASGVLASSLVVDETLQRVADLVVPRLADWCAIDLVGPEGTIDPVAVAHVDPAKVELAWELRRLYPTDPGALDGVANVVRTGRSELVPEIPPELLEDAIRTRPELEPLIRDLQLRSSIVVPLRIGARTFGAITFVWAESGGTYTEEDLALAEDLAQRASVAVENARLYEAEQAARTEEAEAQGRLRILAEAGAALATSLDHRVILSAMTRVLVNGFCDWSVAFLVGRNERVVDAIGAHREPRLEELVRRVVGARLPQIEDPDSLVGRVLRTGVPAVVPEISPAQLRRIMAPGRQLEIAQQLGFSSAIVVPLTERGRPVGALAAIRAPSSPPFDDDDADLAVEVGRRTALALENARLYAEREYVAETLQRSLLPPDLPTIPGLEIGARYLPASEGTSVGGDFYDVFEIDLDHWAAVIGDVVGKGAQAAAMMALARYTIRTAAMSESRPSRILEVLNEAILRQTAEQRFCTACFVRIMRRGETTRVTIASGGHPLPMILRADGSLETVGKPGTLLGVFEDPTLIDEAIDLRRGDAVVMYTDGVTDERRGDEEFGEQRLAELLVSVAGHTAQEIADEALIAVSRFRSDRPRDDIAVLTLRMSP